MIDLSGLCVEFYPDFLGDDVSHYRVFHVLDSGQEIRGFGTAQKPEEALKKAVSEFAERSVLVMAAQELPIQSSNGFAAHISAEKAQASAVAELIERDVVMCSWLARRAPMWIPSESLELNLSLIESLNKFKSAGFDCRIGLLGKVGSVFIVVSVLIPVGESNRFGFTFASAASAQFSSAVESVIFNQRRNLTYALSAIQIWQSQIVEVEVSTPGGHRDFYLNPSHSNAVEWFLNSQTPFVEQKTPDISLKRWSPPVSVPWPLYVYSATSNQLQPYFVGPYHQSKVNLTRLACFFTSESQEINRTLHPLP